MKLQVTHCVKCGTELERGGRGRPSRFCSEGCKTSVEAEMRRINTNLRDLEHSRSLRNIHMPGATKERLEQERARYDASIAELQARYDHLAGVK